MFEVADEVGAMREGAEEAWDVSIAVSLVIFERITPDLGPDANYQCTCGTDLYLEGTLRLL